jgi:hypothetical protein
MRGSHVATALVAVIAMSAANAQDSTADKPAWCPSQATTDVDLDDLSAAMLDAAHVSRAVQKRLEAKGSSFFAGQTGVGQPLTAAEWLIYLHDGTCNFVTCEKDDAQNLFQAYRAFGAVLQGASYTRTGPSDPANFLAAQGKGLRCSATLIAAPTPSGSSTGSTGKALLSFDNFRFRGAAADIVYDRLDPMYGDVDKGKIGFTSDHEADKTEKSFVFDAGYNVSLGAGKLFGQYFEPSITPFFGFDVDKSKTKGVKKVDSDKFETGLALTSKIAVGDRTGGPILNFVSIIPRYVADRDDHSHLLDTQAIWRPTALFPHVIWINALNDIRSTKFQWQPSFDWRFDYGHFLRDGDRTGNDARDFFVRTGPRLGLLLSSNYTQTPIDLSVSRQWGFPISGRNGTLHLWQSSVSIYFTKDKNFGTEFAWTKGRNFDLDDYESKWSLSFVAKY